MASNNSLGKNRTGSAQISGARKQIPYKLAYKTPLCYKTPPKRGHLSRTGHIGGSYMLVDTVYTEQRLQVPPCLLHHYHDILAKPFEERNHTCCLSANTFRQLGWDIEHRVRGVDRCARARYYTRLHTVVWLVCNKKNSYACEVVTDCGFGASFQHPAYLAITPRSRTRMRNAHPSPHLGSDRDTRLRLTLAVPLYIPRSRTKSEPRCSFKATIRNINTQDDPPTLHL